MGSAGFTMQGKELQVSWGSLNHYHGVEGLGFGVWAASEAKFPPQNHPVLTLLRFRILCWVYGYVFALGSRCIEDLWMVLHLR